MSRKSAQDTLRCSAAETVTAQACINPETVVPCLPSLTKISPGLPRWVRQEYRKRFGIETSYRQMNQCRIRTSTRNPVLRLLFVGIALLLRNVWVWFHLNILADRHRNGRVILNLELLRLTTLTLCLQHAAEHLLGCQESAELQTPDWKPLTIDERISG